MSNPSMSYYEKATYRILRGYGKLRVAVCDARFRMEVAHKYPQRNRFGDALNFVMDVHSCLRRLSDAEARLVDQIVFQDVLQREFAAKYRMSLRTVNRKLHDAMHRLAELFLEAGLLLPVRTF